MNDDIKVHVVRFKGRKNLYMRYADPITGKQTARSTGTHQQREAERVAAKWEHDLREGRYRKPGRMSWEDFWERYDTEVLPGLAIKTAKKSWTVRAACERFGQPERIADVNATWISAFQAFMRSNDATEDTINGYLSHLRAALSWATTVGILHEVPTIKRPQRAKGTRAKGRPLTMEEFERMLAAVPKIVGEEFADPWRFYLRGLWFSGLRLAESLELWWDRDDRLSVDISGSRPMLRISADQEKGNRDRVLPVAPEFAEMLSAIPSVERTGRVFNPPRRCHEGERLSDDVVGRTISRIGKKAGIKVWTHPKTGTVKYASAHDLRRSFGSRWAMLVQPAVLMELMRHQNITTTLSFYAIRNAQSTSDAVWDAFSKAQAPGNTLGNTGPETVDFPEEQRR